MIHAAGPFSEWLRPCAPHSPATAAWTWPVATASAAAPRRISSRFAHTRPRALERIGADNLRPVPGASNGSHAHGIRRPRSLLHVRERRMLYLPHRPETCRTYDCRVFTAAGMNAGPDKSVINERIASWRFEYPSPRDHEEHRAVTAAANFIRQHPIRFPGGHVPSRPSEIAVLAVKSYRCSWTSRQRMRKSPRPSSRPAAASTHSSAGRW